MITFLLHPLNRIFNRPFYIQSFYSILLTSIDLSPRPSSLPWRVHYIFFYPSLSLITYSYIFQGMILALDSGHCFNVMKTCGLYLLMLLDPYTPFK